MHWLNPNFQGRSLTARAVNADGKDYLTLT